DHAHFDSDTETQFHTDRAPPTNRNIAPPRQQPETGGKTERESEGGKGGRGTADCINLDTRLENMQLTPRVARPKGQTGALDCRLNCKAPSVNGKAIKPAITLNKGSPLLPYLHPGLNERTLARRRNLEYKDRLRIWPAALSHRTAQPPVSSGPGPPSSVLV
ncbi:hypothetical protein BaRGS_00029756, partial [Batillaria attramentaria]